ncbi:MAG: nicotinate-nucleotide adenylyltransferase [Deltaproteobacteria bacterium]|jgi:nicotinate-nucleotide adenylyltransferase|nr:nicotinate-nucleotide adenylyltransferase [Deltaproteobacteria bacterium]
MTERLGFFGGTFDPIHYGHLRVAEELAESLRLDRVFFIPAAQHPHKLPDGPVAFQHRLEMLKLAIEDRPGFEVSDIERFLPKPSFTINTVQALKAQVDGQCFFLVGYDSFQHIKKWAAYELLLKLCPMVVFRRPGVPGGRAALQRLLAKITGAPPQWDPDQGALVTPGWPLVHYYEGCCLEISSTDLRQRLAAGESVRYLAPEATRAYLLEHGLYSPTK